MLLHVNSKRVIFEARHFYYFKLVFDSEHISAFRIVWGVFSNTKCVRKQNFELIKNRKTTNLSQNSPKMTIRNFSNISRRSFK